jgi:shikimate kinase
MKIYLVGMPGAGKSTLGKKLARVLGVDFVDLDEEIEKFCGMDVPAIFIGKGENYFREVESRLLLEWAGSTKNFIMATGGGAPCSFRGMEVINKTGLSIFLDVPITELLRRVNEQANRPLLQDAAEREQTLMKLLETRQPCYRQARITISNPNLDNLLEAIHFKK